MFTEGQILDNTYRIVRLLGEGGMGVVYEAAHARLAGRYAIKVLLQRLSDDPEALARFDREARITSSLQHPNIVQVIDFNKLEDGSEYLVMEYLDGETLAERLRRMGKLSLESIVSIVDQVAAGLAAAHAHGIVHRDLKPDNVFLIPVAGRHGELVKVLDFGISKIRDANRGFQGPESALMGTPQYMSPEQCKGQAVDVDARTDQFALAVLTYEMLTGRTPFAGDNLGAILGQILYSEPPPMVEVRESVERVVRRGLAKFSSHRFESVTAFAEAFRDAAADPGLPVHQAFSGPAYPARHVTGGVPLTGSTWPDLRDHPRDGATANLRRSRRGWATALVSVGAVCAITLGVLARKIDGTIERKEAGAVLGASPAHPLVPPPPHQDMTQAPAGTASQSARGEGATAPPPTRSKLEASESAMASTLPADEINSMPSDRSLETDGPGLARGVVPVAARASSGRSATGAGSRRSDGNLRKSRSSSTERRAPPVVSMAPAETAPSSSPPDATVASTPPAAPPRPVPIPVATGRLAPSRAGAGYDEDATLPLDERISGANPSTRP